MSGAAPYALTRHRIISLAVSGACAATVILFFLFPYTIKSITFSPHVPVLLLGSSLALLISFQSGLPRMEWVTWFVLMWSTGLSVLTAPASPDIATLRSWLFSLLAFWLCRIGLLLLSERGISVAVQLLLALYGFCALGQTFFGEAAYVSLWFGQPVRTRYATGLAAFPGQAGLLLLPLLMLTLVANLEQPRWWRGAIWAVGCASLYLTLSRSGWLALLVALAAFVFLMHPGSRRLVRWTLLHVLVGLTAALIAWILPTSVDCYEFGGWCAAGRWEITDYSANTRIATMKVAVLAISDYPLTGIGLGQFPEYYSTHSTKVEVAGEINQQSHIGAHNAYAQFAAEFGLPAFLVLLFTIGTLLRFAVQNRSLTSLALCSSCLGALAFLLFHDGFFDRIFWIFLGCAVAFGQRNRTKLQAPL